MGRDWRDVAREQHGVVHREQLLDCGLTSHMIRKRVARAELVTVLPSTYRVGGVPDSWHARLMAGQLWGGDCFISHRAAGAIWGLDGFEHQQLVELSTYSAKRHRDVISHRLDAEDRPAMRTIGGFRVSSLERTLLDVAGVTPRPIVERALEDALRKGLTTLDRLWEDLELDGGTGRKGTGPLRAMLEAHDDSAARTRSVLESKMLRILKGVQEQGLEIDHLVTDGAARYYLDFAYPAMSLGIETHGIRWHFGNERWQRDLERDRRLARLGWEVLYFTWNDVHRNPQTVEEEVRGFLRTRADSALP